MSDLSLTYVYFFFLNISAFKLLRFRPRAFLLQKLTLASLPLTPSNISIPFIESPFSPLPFVFPRFPHFL